MKQENRVVWILDSGCSRHMTGDRALLSKVVEKAGPVHTFGDNNKGLTHGYGSYKLGMLSLKMYQLCKVSTQSPQYRSIL